MSKQLKMLVAMAGLAVSGCNMQDWDTCSPNEVPGGWDDIRFHGPGDLEGAAPARRPAPMASAGEPERRR